jgi:hypothetical protein
VTVLAVAVVLELALELDDVAAAAKIHPLACTPQIAMLRLAVPVVLEYVPPLSDVYTTTVDPLLTVDSHWPTLPCLCGAKKVK